MSYHRDWAKSRGDFTEARRLESELVAVESVRVGYRVSCACPVDGSACAPSSIGLGPFVTRVGRPRWIHMIQYTFGRQELDAIDDKLGKMDVGEAKHR